MFNAVVVEKVIGRRSGDEDRGVYAIHLSFLDYLLLSVPE